MELIKEIHTDWINLRKSRNTKSANIVGYLYAQADAKRKELGSITDDEVIATVKNLINKAEDLLKVSKTLAPEIQFEIDTLSKYLPEMVSEHTLRAAVASGITNEQKIGQIMNTVKKIYGQQADMKLVAKLIKEAQA